MFGRIRVGMVMWVTVKGDTRVGDGAWLQMLARAARGRETHLDLSAKLWAGRDVKFWVRAVVGVLLLAFGVQLARRAFNYWGWDFAPQYVAAWMLREGKNVYDFDVQHDGYMRHIGQVTTWAHFYPPSASVAALPATLVSYAVARDIWFVVTFGVMFWGVWHFMTVFIPRWDNSVKLLVLGLLASAACTRWSFKVAQPGPVVLGLFGVFLAELKKGRSWTCVLCGALVVSTKVTFGIPFFLVALALRRVRMVVIMLAFWGVLNVVGLYGMGGPKILADYKANFAQFERPDQLNYPDPRGWNSLARTDWPYVLNAIQPNFQRNTLIGYALTLLSTAWLAREALRAKKRINEDAILLAVAGVVAPLSMLAVYHHHYDMSILLLPVIGYIGLREFRGVRAVWWYVVPVTLYTCLYPYGKGANFLKAAFGANEVLVSKPLACVVCIVGLVAAFAVLHRMLQRTQVSSDSVESDDQAADRLERGGVV